MRISLSVFLRENFFLTRNFELQMQEVAASASLTCERAHPIIVHESR